MFNILEIITAKKFKISFYIIMQLPLYKYTGTRFNIFPNQSKI